ncbi:efflux RND transporter permease subunit [Salmonella enterica subsp. enterica]|nr:efflux RND transporter permease subunit [Salmonella enterica subsp. enterica]
MRLKRATKRHGLTPEQAIFEGLLVTLPSIMMTTLAALFGALPLAVIWRNGSDTAAVGDNRVGGLVARPAPDAHTHAGGVRAFRSRLRLRFFA